MPVLPKLKLTKLCRSLLLVPGIATFIFTQAQAIQSPTPDAVNLPPHILSKYCTDVISKTDLLQNQLDKKTNKFLLRMQKAELKLKKRLAKKDSLAAERLFSGKAQSINNTSFNYNPYLDTIKTSLQFLQYNADKINGLDNKLKSKIENAISKSNAFNYKMNQAQAVQQLLKERRQYLKEQLSRYGLTGHMKKMNKEIFYYSQSIRECKELLRDRKKIERKALALLRKTPAFKKFMQRNSQLASIFSVPSDNPSPVAFAGLQTRVSVQQQIRNSVPAGTTNPQQFLAQQLQSANQQIADHRKGLRFPEWQENLGDIPDFKPNEQRTRSFFRRLEFGSNIQFGKINWLLPATSDLAMSVGYKLNNNGIVGIGSSYRLGLGTGINRIRFSNEGYGFRSFVDWKLKGRLYISGGYEKNYLPGLRSAIQRGAETWQESGLIGISRKYPISKSKKGNFQLLFDFLSYKNLPRSQPVIVRTGIHF